MAEPDEAQANKVCTQKFTAEAIAAVTDYVHEALSANSDEILHINDLNTVALNKYTKIAETTQAFSQRLAFINEQYVDLASKLKSVDFILEKIPLLEAKVAKLDAFVMSLEERAGRTNP